MERKHPEDRRTDPDLDSSTARFGGPSRTSLGRKEAKVDLKIVQMKDRDRRLTEVRGMEIFEMVVMMKDLPV